MRPSPFLLSKLGWGTCWGTLRLRSCRPGKNHISCKGGGGVAASDRDLEDRKLSGKNSIQDGDTGHCTGVPTGGKARSGWGILEGCLEVVARAAVLSIMCSALC